jgi:hypothetical protein
MYINYIVFKINSRAFIILTMSTQGETLKNDMETNRSNDVLIKKEEDNVIKEDFPSDKKKLCGVVLNQGVSYFNLFSYYLVQFSYVCAFTFIDACQDYLLEDPKYYGIDKNKVGTINGDILLWDTLYLVYLIFNRLHLSMYMAAFMISLDAR